MLQVDALGFRISVGNYNQLRESGPVRVVIHAGFFYRVPVTIHQHLRILMAHEAQVAVGVVVFRRELPGLYRAAAGKPYRWMRLLQWLRPWIDIAQLGEAAVECERSGPRPCLLDQIMRFVVTRADLRRWNSIASGRIHRRADRKTSYQATTAQAIEQGKLLRDANRRIVKWKRVAQHH